MSTADERVLALAVARGLLEPHEAHGISLDALVASGRLSVGDRRMLAQDLTDLEAIEASHWSREITAQIPTGRDEAPTRAEPLPPPSEPLGPSTGFRHGGVFRARTLGQWGRFESLELLGEGGMGRIFRAMDPRLRRVVALKLLRRDDPDLLQRFLQEAQLQARVDHPNVCRVYEVGEWRGQPYIAMQFLRGATLQKAAPSLPLEALLRHMVEVCEGVHAAHRVGLVHRDLKPANLMIDRSEDGSAHACVLDFGLARGAEGTGLTETGRVMGTVSYMSPEQARGNTALLDRRSDVYSLGATLHALLTGAPPFAGEGLECMARIVKDDPVPLRRKVPTIPADLETVVLTCLQKDPRRRYATARALGEDLQRILDGEPIQARPATLFERITHWARKRKALVAASAAVLLTIAVSSGFAVRERLRARTQAAHAQRFAQAAERIEALARYLRIQPARDLTRDQAELRSRVDGLAQEVRAAGPLAEAPGAYALGRARLALDDPSSARTQLEQAWTLGFRAPEAAHALGRALAAIYQVEVGKAYALPDPDLRQRRIDELKQTLRGPAADWLRRGASASLEPPAFRAGLLTLLEGQPLEAVRLAREAQEQSPWFYEALRLEAEGWLAQARGATAEQAAKPALEAAGRALAEAELRAPCDIDLLRLDMRRWQEAVVLGWRSERDPAPLVAAELDVADRWARLEPSAAQPVAWRARARAEEARYLSLREINPGAWLIQAKADAGEALRRDPRDVDAITAHASVLRTEGIRAMSLGEDPTLWLREGVKVAQGGLRQFPGEVVLANISSSCLLAFLDSVRFRGTYDPQEAQEFLRDYRDRARSHPDLAYHQANLGTIALAIARAEGDLGGDPGPEAVEAIKAYEAALAIQPDHAAFHRGVLMALAEQAKAQARSGKDPVAILAAARVAYEKAQSRRVPAEVYAPFLAESALAKAAYELAIGGKPGPSLEEARRTQDLARPDGEDPVKIGTLRLWLEALDLQAGRIPRSGALRRVEAVKTQLLRLEPVDLGFWDALSGSHAVLGEKNLARTEWARVRKRNPRWTRLPGL
jgi:serine/threonine-protein kinase